MDLNVTAISLDNVNLPDSLVVYLILLILIVFILVGCYFSNTKLGFWMRKKVTFSATKKNTCKTNASILFIDDKDIPIASTLADDGWDVSKLRDADTDHELVKKSDIIFVDWKGVGKKISSENQGIALAENIKRKYGHNKYVILYSAREYSKPDGATCDDWINKGSDFSDYMDTITRACHVLCK